MPTKRNAYDYARQVLDIMAAEADSDGLWRGVMSKLVAQVTSIGSYSRVLRVLETSGAIRQVKRGGGASPSVWEVLDVNADLSKGTWQGAALEKRRTLELRVEELERLVGGVDVPQALADLALEVRKHGS